MKNGNYKEVKKVLWIILIANMLVASIKVILGIMIKSASMTADGFHSVSDGASNIVGLMGVTIASKPKDIEHPYGHKKFEIMASMFIGVMLTFIGINIIIESIDRFQNPLIPTIEISTLIVLIITIVINLFVSKYEENQGHKLGSHILISDSKHTRSDVFVSIGVLITLIGVRLGLPPIIDVITSICVAIFILHAAYEIFKESIDILVDRNAVDENIIKEIVEEYNEVRGVHNIRSRGSKHDMHIDMHILIHPLTSIEKAHELSHDIEDAISSKLNGSVQVIVHLEPFY